MDIDKRDTSKQTKSKLQRDIDRISKGLFAPLLPAKLKKQSDIMLYLRENTILAKGMHYYDTTASALAFKPIEKRIAKILPFYANTHSVSSSMAAIMSHLYERAHDEIASALSLPEGYSVIATGSGSSSAMLKMQAVLGIYIPPMARRYIDIKKEDKYEVLITPYEHHSLELPYRDNPLVNLTRLPYNDDERIDASTLYSALDEIASRRGEGFYEENKKDLAGTKLIACLSMGSNVTGRRLDIKTLAPILRRAGAIILLDLASYLTHASIDARLFDGAFISPHKFLGGVGSCGLLVAKDALFADEPSFSGGGSVSYVGYTGARYAASVSMREEAGTPPILGLIRAALAIRLQKEVGYSVIARRERVLLEVFYAKVAKIYGLKIYGKAKHDRAAIVALNILGISPYELGSYLSKRFGIQARAGCSCAGPYGHDLLGLEERGSIEDFSMPPGWLRISLHYTQSIDDVRYIANALLQASYELR